MPNIDINRMLRRFRPGGAGFYGDSDSLSPYTFPPVETAPPMQVDVHDSSSPFSPMNVPDVQSTYRARDVDLPYHMPGAYPAQEALLSAYRNMPTEREPGWFNRLTAGLGGLSAGYLQGPGAGVETARNIREYPYRRQFERWQRGLVPLEAASQAEAANVQRGMAYNKEAFEVQKEQESSRQKEAELKLRAVGERSGAIGAAARLGATEAQQQSYLHPEQKTVNLFPPGSLQPNVYAFDPRSTKTTMLGKGMPYGDLALLKIKEAMALQPGVPTTPTEYQQGKHFGAQNIIESPQGAKFAEFYDYDNQKFVNPYVEGTQGQPAEGDPTKTKGQLYDEFTTLLGGAGGEQSNVLGYVRPKTPPSSPPTKPGKLPEPRFTVTRRK